MGIRGREGEGAQEKNEGEGDDDEQKKMTKSGCKQKYARMSWRDGRHHVSGVVWVNKVFFEVVIFNKSVATHEHIF
jgi:hypothetical protein